MELYNWSRNNPRASAEVTEQKLWSKAKTKAEAALGLVMSPTRSKQAGRVIQDPAPVLALTDMEDKCEDLIIFTPDEDALRAPYQYQDGCTGMDGSGTWGHDWAEEVDSWDTEPMGSSWTTLVHQQGQDWGTEHPKMGGFWEANPQDTNANQDQAHACDLMHGITGGTPVSGL